MAESMPPLDPRVLALLRVDRAPPPEAKARVRGRLETQIPSLRRTSVGPSAGVGASGPMARHAIHAAIFLLGGVTGAGAYAYLKHPPPARIVYVDRPTTGAVNAPPGEHPSALPVAIATSPPAKGAAGTPSQEPIPSQPQLAAERRLLDSARAALVRGDADHALLLLDAHRAQFPRGALTEERDALSIQSLVKAGRNDEARAKARAFKERTPDSLFSSAVESAIESISVTGEPH